MKLIMRGFFMKLVLMMLGSCLGVVAGELQPGSPAKLRLVTYNVLADPVHVEKRLPELFRILREAEADIIVLQEFAPWMAKKLLQESWVAGYHRPLRGNKTAIAQEYLLLSKFPILDFQIKPLPGQQRRAFFLATLDIDGVKTAITTCHLESLLEDGPMRAQQLDIYFNEMAPFDEAFFAGDFNFGHGEQPDTSHLLPSFRDAWLELQPKDPGYTWNIEKSRFARNESFPGEGSRRLDRILFKSARWRPVSAVIIGDQPLDGKSRLVFPSDHFGLLAVFERVAVNP
jgi:endonuclease/exonuclease/phosphatase family metal-dependent hydrolase